MKRALWALAVVTLLGCGNTKAPEKEAKATQEKVETVDVSKFESNGTKQDISEILSFDDQELQQPEQGLRSMEQDLWGIDQNLWLVDQNLWWLELDSRQQRIRDMISQIREPIIVWDLSQQNVAISIDDGYGRKSIEYMLDLFKKNNVKATFFVIWECLRIHSDLWRRAAQQWHEICNHTDHHNKYFKTWDEPERFERELLWWEKTVKEVLWEDYLLRMKKNYPFFRFPWMYWIREKAYLDILKKHGYIPIWWRYTENPKNGVVNNGDIFLWHFKDQDTTNVRKSLELILQNGKQPKTVSDIITSDGYDEPIWWHNVHKKKSRTKK